MIWNLKLTEFVDHPFTIFLSKMGRSCSIDFNFGCCILEEGINKALHTGLIVQICRFVSMFSCLWSVKFRNFSSRYKNRPIGLEAWFVLWVDEVPGSIPGSDRRFDSALHVLYRSDLNFLDYINQKRIDTSIPHLLCCNFILSPLLSWWQILSDCLWKQAFYFLLRTRLLPIFQTPRDRHGGILLVLVTCTQLLVDMSVVGSTVILWNDFILDCLSLSVINHPVCGWYHFSIIKSYELEGGNNTNY